MGRYEIEGKVVLITGAGNGIGRDVARRLGPMGAKLALVSYYFDHHGDAPYLRPSSGREARKAARSFPLSDYRYETLRRSPEPAEREKVTA